MSNLFTLAEQNWPEDEAYGLICNWSNAPENGWSHDEIREGVQKDIDHMVKVFSKENDAEDLIARFKAEIRKTYDWVA
jgi:ABC-type enterochelin transport system substrate-binding protein